MVPGKKLSPVKFPKQPAHELVVKLIDNHCRRKRLSTQDVGAVWIGNDLLSTMVIPGDKLKKIISQLKRIARRSFDAEVILHKLVGQLERDYQDLVR